MLLFSTNCTLVIVFFYQSLLAKMDFLESLSGYHKEIFSNENQKISIWVFTSSLSLTTPLLENVGLCWLIFKN